MDPLRIVLDTNEFIFGLGANPQPASAKLLTELLTLSPPIELFLPQTIVDEMRRKCHPRLFNEFLKIFTPIVQVDSDVVIPFALGCKYSDLGFKPADSLIAAYCEYRNIQILVSENRHFLSRQTDLSFKVVTAEACLKLIKSS